MPGDRKEKQLGRDFAYEAMLLSHVNDGVIGADADSRITYWGRGAERMYGYTEAEALGKTTLELLRPTYDPGERERIFANLETLGTAVSTVRTKRKDGAEVIAEVNSTRLVDERGNRTGYVVVYRDVTERTGTRQALSQANERLRVQAEELQLREGALRGILNAAKESIWRFSPDGIILMGNETALKRIGKSADEVIGRHFSEFMSPELAALRLAKLREASESRRPVEFEDERSGMSFRHNFYPVLDTEGNVSSIACFSRDITQRKRDEQALRERGIELQRLTEALETRVQERTGELAAANEMLKAEAAERVRLVAAVEQADEGLVIMDAEGLIRYANSAFSRLSGCSRDELLAMSYDRLLAGRGKSGETWENVRASLDRGEAWHGRLTRGDDAGDALELEVTVSPIYDATGRAINYLAVERDVTRELRLQQHLRQVQKLEALGTLAGGIAHDFNNILNPIFISTELLLLESSLDPSDRRQLEITLKAAERGRDLVRQIIAFSRQKEKDRKPSKAGPVVNEAVRFLRVSLPSTVEIRADIRDTRDVILGDQAQIHQIVMNLCNNAAYAMREKGGILTLSLAEVDVDAGFAAQVPGLKPGAYLRLAVSDTGTGMTPEVRERAFDPFFTTKRPGEGSGMGLAVVDGIVRDYGGAISVVSDEGKGSTFTVYLPRVASEEPSSQAAPDGPPRGSERILLLDDELVQVQSVRAMLRRLGYEVVALTDGQEALTRIRADPQAFDLLITDQTMPHLTGVKLAKEVLGIRPDLPIILCTGYSEAVDANEARALGIRDFLMKPYSVREMAETVRRALSGDPEKKP